MKIGMRQFACHTQSSRKESCISVPLVLHTVFVDRNYRLSQVLLRTRTGLRAIV